MRPTSKRCSLRFPLAWLALAVVGTGCFSRTPEFPTTARFAADTPRKPPGLPDSPAAVVPDAAREGDTQDRLLVLRSPEAPALARSVVRGFLRAAVNEQPERLEPLLSAQAFVDTGSGRQPARAFWRSRLTQLDYTELKGQLLFRDSDVETFRAEDLSRLSPNRRPHVELGQDDVLVRIPIRVSWLGKTRFFGDEMLFRLQPSGQSFEIAEISEDFRLP